MYMEIDSLVYTRYFSSDGYRQKVLKELSGIGYYNLAGITNLEIIIAQFG